MNQKKLWIYASGFFAGVGMCLAGLVATAQAQWGSNARITMSRGQIGHTIHNPGMSGKKDNRTKLAQSSFSYPQGRDLKVYSGGSEREGWNAKSHSGGEGFWVLSKSGNSYAGSRVLSSDIVGRAHDMTVRPEAYLGVVEANEWAMAIRASNGNQASWTNGSTVADQKSNWWPAANGIASPSPNNAIAVNIWNFRFGKYPSGESYADRIAKGELPQYNAPAWAEALSEDDFPAVVGIQEGGSTKSGLEWTRQWSQSDHPDYDEFLIVENVVVNTSGATVEDVYITFQNRMMNGQATAWRNGSWDQAHDYARDDHARFTLASNYLDGVTRDAFVAGAGKPAGLQRGVDLANAGHAIVYNHDGESDHVTNLVPDVGDQYRYDIAVERYTREQTWVREGMIQHGDYFGLGTVDAFAPFMRYGGVDDETYVAPHDNSATANDESKQQPASVLFHEYRNLNDFDYPSPDIDSDQFIYDSVANGGYSAEPTAPQMSTQIVAYGPYTLAPGEKAKVVVAYVVGLAGDHAKYANYKTYAKPFNVGWSNLYGGLGSSPVKFSDRQKDIPLSEDVMFDHFENAINMYNWGFDIPNQPPSIKVAFDSNLQGKTQIRWSAFGEDSADPDYSGVEAQDLRGYRVYRSNVEYQGEWEYVTEFSFEDARSGNLPTGVSFDPSKVWSNVKSGNWPTGIPLTSNQFVNADDPAAGSAVPGTYTFDDPGTNAGFPNWYAVRYYDSGHADWNGTGTSIPVLESSQTTGSGGIVGARTGVVPVVPGAAVFDRLEEQVRVVPNPFKADSDLHTYNRQQNMRFINLPGRAQIDLYDVTGQRIWTFFNNDPLKGEVAYLQFAENRPSDFGEAMFPGIYFWKVTSLMPGSEGKTQQGTFLIIK
jgi:hypothetical protein